MEKKEEGFLKRMFKRWYFQVLPNPACSVRTKIESCLGGGIGAGKIEGRRNLSCQTRTPCDVDYIVKKEPIQRERGREVKNGKGWLLKYSSNDSKFDL